MKKTLTPLLVLLSFAVLHSQEFIGEKIKCDQWKTNEVLTFTTSDGQAEIQAVARPKKVKKNKKRIRHLKINGQKYQLVATSGVINFLDTEGNILLKTNAERSEIFLADNQRFVKKGNLRTVELVDDQGNIAVKGMIVKGVIRLRNYQNNLNEPLLAICLEEMLRLEMQRQQGSFQIFDAFAILLAV